MNVSEIPIIINAYNRLTCLQDLISFLQTKKVPNPVIILDNKSTYEPLLEYYKTLPYEIIYLKQNLGHKALWTSGHSKRFQKSHFVLTDPDVVPVDECPADFMEHFFKLMKAYPNYKKVGFGLKLDDLPDHFPSKVNVQNWEAQFWKRPLGDGIYGAPIDTTFALFHPQQREAWGAAIRTGHPYIARHTTWYLNPEDLPADEAFYKDSIKTVTHWSNRIK